VHDLRRLRKEVRLASVGRAIVLTGAVLLATLATACESDTAKAERLRQEEATSALEAWYHRKVVDSLMRELARAKTEVRRKQLDSALDSARAAAAKSTAEHDVAVRQLNAFIRGR
jgi:hypothetical protein